MKILYIVTESDRGGAQKYVLAMAEHFQGLIAAGGTNSFLFQEAEALGINSYKLHHLKRNIHPYHDFLGIIELVRLIKNIKPDIVHLNSSKAGFIGSIAGKISGAKVLFTAHGLFFFENTPLLIRITYTILEKFASMFRDYIITVSERDRINALKYKIILPQKIRTIHNGLSQINFLTRGESRARLGLDDKLVIGCIAQYYHRKGLDIIVESIHLLPTELKEKISVVLIGDGPENNKLTQQITQLGLLKIFKLTGSIADAARYLKAFDIFVLSSRVEGFPYVLLEAILAELPIIATDVGGVKEALGEAGMIIEPNNQIILAAAIKQLIINSDLRKSLTAKSMEKSKTINIEIMFSKTKEVYDNLLKIP